MSQTALSTTLLSQVSAIVTPQAEKLDPNGLINLVDRVGSSLLGFAQRAHEIETDRATSTSVPALTSGHKPFQPAVGPSLDDTDLVEDVAPKSAQPAPAPEAAAPEVAAEPEPVRQPPAVPVEQSIDPEGNYIISLEDGQKYKVLTRHLKGLGMTPEQYRAKWGLSGNYPMVAPNFAETRRDIAKKMGFGKRKGGGNAAAVATMAAAEAAGLIPASVKEAVNPQAASAEVQGQTVAETIPDQAQAGAEQTQPVAEAGPVETQPVVETGAVETGAVEAGTTEQPAPAGETVSEATEQTKDQATEAKANETPKPSRPKRTTSSRTAAAAKKDDGKKGTEAKGTPAKGTQPKATGAKKAGGSKKASGSKAAAA